MQNSRRYSCRSSRKTFAHCIARCRNVFTQCIFAFFNVVSPLTDSIFKQLLGHMAVNGTNLTCIFGVISEISPAWDPKHLTCWRKLILDSWSGNDRLITRCEKALLAAIPPARTPQKECSQRLDPPYVFAMAQKQWTNLSNKWNHIKILTKKSAPPQEGSIVWLNLIQFH